MAAEPGPPADDWDARLDALRARAVLERLAPQHRLALTLRYVDDLPVAAVAELLDRTLHATEALLVRAKVAFRAEYRHRAIEWYADVLGATLVGEPVVMPDGVIYLADEYPEIGVRAPTPGAASVSLMLTVDDADAVRRRALAAGASGDREPYDAYGTRNTWIVDPFGHRWGLQSPLPATPDLSAARELAARSRRPR